MLLTYPPTPELSSIETPDFSAGKRLHLYTRGEEIPLTSQGIWEVYRGVVQLSKFSTTGENTILGWAVPSYFVGMWLTEPEICQARALSEVYLRWYSLREIDSNLNLMRLVLNQVALRVRQTEALLAIVSLRRIEDRLLELFSLLKREMGEPVEEGIRFIARLTHQNLANTIGTTRVTITRMLGDFQSQDLIALDSQRHLIIKF